MALPEYKNIRSEDFSGEMRSAIDKIAFSINPFAEQIIGLFNKRIGFENLNQEVITLDNIEVDGSGNVTRNNQFKTSISGNAKGSQCIKVDNKTDGTYPTSSPFVSFTQSNNLITINNITGLQINKVYRINILIIGQ